MDSTLAEQSNDVTLAFTGHQIQRVLHDELAVLGVTLTFEVDRVFKGEAPPLVEVVTNAQNSACGVTFGDVGTVGVVAFTSRESLVVGLCSSPVSVSELEKVFGPGYDPIVAQVGDGDGSPWGLVGAVAAGVAALAGAWIIGVRRASD